MPCPAGPAALRRKKWAWAKRRLYGKDELVDRSRPRLRQIGYSVPFAGEFNPKYFITICKSFHASFFCRGSRNKYAGWYVASSLEFLKSYQRPRRFVMESFTASRFLAATAPSATMTLGLMISIWRIRKGEQVSHSSFSGVRLLGGRHFTTFAM